MAVWRKMWVAAAIGILSLMQPSTVLANGGPLMEPADGNGNLQFDPNSNIRLVAEKVIYSIRGPDGADDTEVLVEYELHNRNGHIKTADILFLTPASGDFTVTEGSHKLTTAPATRGIPIDWHTDIKYNVVDPISSKILEIPDGYGIKATGTRFSLTFKPNERKHIHIRYRDSGGMYDKGVINTVFTHLYYLTPAEFWDGDPRVELEVKFAQPGSRLNSNLPLQKSGPLSYKAAFDRLPDNDWYFSYTYPKRLLFPTNVERDHNLLVLAAAAVLTAIAAWLALKLRNTLIFFFQRNWDLRVYLLLHYENGRLSV
ncbi:hypothetical protein SD71_20320 [Cohnella kolymensis]|uniref:Uncharacterized protein n=1 Tax=Cohnella kolymensis TaxID=1590652 RepID=A0ABR5A1F0_9BACL|nr:hypothetical protein [Cohnella kolymensis]KIL34375.1 hypothetical protein SD71_20320 [Cohnella kolymensis]